MIRKKISNNPLFANNPEIERWIAAGVYFPSSPEIILTYSIYYLNKKGEHILQGMNIIDKTISTKYKWVDMNGDTVEKVSHEQIEGEDPIPDSYPEGSIPEIEFMKAIPLNVFPNVNTLYEAIQAFENMYIDKLDQKGKFNF